MNDEPTYKIKRFYKDPDKTYDVIKTGLTLEEAMEHCEDPTTRTDEWFDGFTEE
jgi:hypothetical protein